MVVPGLGGPDGTTGGDGHGGGPPAGHGGILVGGGPAGSRSGAPAGGQGGATGISSTTPAPGTGKQTRVILDDDEVSSDEDEPLQKRLRQLSGVGPTVLDEAVATDKEATDKRVMEDAMAKRAVEERAAAKAAAAEEVAGKTADEATRAVGGSPALSQVPSAAGDKRVVAPSGSTPPAKRPYKGVWKPRFVQRSLPIFSFLSGASFSYYTFCPCLLPPARPPRLARLLLS
jgi:hypothetical protein